MRRATQEEIEQLLETLPSEEKNTKFAKGAHNLILTAGTDLALLVAFLTKYYDRFDEDEPYTTSDDDIDEDTDSNVVEDDDHITAGNYDIYFARMLFSNKNGSLVHDGAVSADVAKGDFGSFVFDAVAGEVLRIRVVDPPKS